ncbi:MAG TPA: SDR family oxidoreductase, partial [Solirubrobacterales bacterium]|nr:SDR family oxidoreductase [Solirubrobacterales bacterium]
MNNEKHHLLISGAAARLHETDPGIGFAIARLAARRGHRVSIVDVSSNGLRGAKAALGGEGLACDLAVADVSDSEAVEAAVQRLGAERAITAVVNSAALLRSDRAFSPFDSMDAAEIRAAVGVNVLGVLNTVRAALPKMLARGSGVVVNIGSISAAHPASGLATYAMTKAAVRSVTGTLGAELGRRGIHVQGLAPGIVRTGLHDLTPARYRAS